MAAFVNAGTQRDAAELWLFGSRCQISYSSTPICRSYAGYGEFSTLSGTWVNQDVDAIVGGYMFHHMGFLIGTRTMG
jgi:hypothetical protein